MVILFLLALLLAWPTFGGSILAFFAYAIFKSYADARMRMHYANQKHALREVAAGATRKPSWAFDTKEREIFIEIVQETAVRRGVPQKYLWASLGNGETFQSMLYFAGAMEQQGASKTEQYSAVADRLIEMWQNAPRNVKNAALSS